ncbi:50S ribosomal protein L35, chloroplastic [Sesamum angolense]|uniref:50S ribosomal protein L35 n=1 Tax=Sesamum angolense TaxID=2727404 RepID=A0AAE1WG31_9LAMI|nr:50S ribosomal protein L35, chloroplastic [Sesamum angolense]
MTAATMATTGFSFGLTTVPPRREIRTAAVAFTFTPFIKKQASSLNLSSSRSISGLGPLVLSKTLTAAGPVQRNSQPLTVASAKRFRVSGSGKIMRRRAGKQHLLRKKNTKGRLRLSKMVQVDRSDYNNVIGALPYLKVNRSN